MPVNTHTIQLLSEGLPTGEIEVARVEGREALSQLFELEVTIVCKDDAGLDEGALLGKQAELVFSTDGREVRRIGGMIAVIDDLLDTETRYSTYRLGFVPRAWRLTQNETLDVYLELSVPEIIKKKLDGVGLAEGDDFELRLYETYPKREFVVQYRETDLAFISRLTEHLGVTFFFETREGRDVMVFTDRNEGFPELEPSSPVPFRPRGDQRDVWSLEARTRVVPMRHVVRDYNYRQPQMDLTASAEVTGGNGSVVEYGAHFKDPDEGARLAKIRLEEHLCGKKVFRGKSDVAMLASGARFVLEGHPRGDLQLLVTEVTHRGAPVAVGTKATEGREYENEFVAILSSVTYRPARVTPKPRVHGVLTGIIDAPEKSKYAKVDDEGRYKVKFLFDTSEKGEGQASRAVRMAQPHAGEGYGMHFPLRPGVEVMLTCVDGDPDRPIIAGTVPNPTTPSPVISDNAEKNVIRTGGGNQIDIDDTEDGQRIKLTTPAANTTFQLGSPNAPELGAALTTGGAYSTLATAGTNLITSFNSSFNLFSKWSSAGDITTVAEKPDGLGKALMVISAIDSLLAFGAAAYDIGRSSLAIHLAYKEAEKKEAENKVALRQAELDALQITIDNSESALTANLPAVQTPAPSPESADHALARAIAEYNAAKSKLATDEAALATATSDLDDANRKKNDLNAKESGQGDSLVTQRTTIKTARQTTVDADKTDLAAKKAALDAALAAVPANSSYAAQATAYAGALTAKQAAENRDPPMSSLQSDLADKKKRFDDDTYSFTESDTAKRFSAAKFSIDSIRTVGGLISAVMTLVNTIKSAKAQLDEAKSWSQLATEIGVVKPRSQAGKGAEWTSAALVGTHITTHTIGSQDNTLIYGEKQLFLRSATIGMWGKDEISLLASKDASILSSQRAELQGNETTFIGGKLIDALADETYKVLAKKMIDLKSEADAKIESKDTLDAKSNKIELNAKMTAAILADSKLTAKVGNFKLELEKAKASLVKNDLGLEISGATAKLMKGSSAHVMVGPGTVTIKGSSVTVNGQKIQLG